MAVMAVMAKMISQFQSHESELTFLVKKTPHNMDCQANYEMGTCSRVNLACKFKLAGKGKTCKGDRAVVTFGTETKM